MALILADRVQETTNTTGTGTLTLAGAVAGYQSFAAIGNGNTTYYTILSGTAWENGIGTYTSAGTTLARTTILSSSNSNAAINVGAGASVFATYPSKRAVIVDGTGNIPQTTTAGLGTTVLPGEVLYRLAANRTALLQTTAQSVFGVGVTLAGSTVYQFEGLYEISKSGASGVGLISLSFGGTATLNNIGYDVFRYYDTVAFTTANTPPASYNYYAVANAGTSMSTDSTATNSFHIFRLRGMVSVNAGGTFIPQFTTSTAAAGAPVVQINSYFKLSPLGASGANTSIGNWA